MEESNLQVVPEKEAEEMNGRALNVEEFMKRHFIFDALQSNESRDVLYAKMKSDLENMLAEACDIGLNMGINSK